jgi:hypothetical protein
MGLTVISGKAAQCGFIILTVTLMMEAETISVALGDNSVLTDNVMGMLDCIQPP